MRTATDDDDGDGASLGPAPWGAWVAELRQLILQGKVSELAFAPSGDNLEVLEEGDRRTFITCGPIGLRGGPSDSDDGDPLAMSTAVLVGQAGAGSAWNERRRHVDQAGAPVDMVRAELALSAALLTHHHKANEAWEYRRWLLAQLPDEEIAVAAELALCTLACTKRPRNYYGWQHRRHVIARHVSTPDALRAEMQFATAYCAAHTRDASAADYLCHILATLLPILPGSPHPVGCPPPEQCRCQLLRSAFDE
eukprot:gene5068-5171_t